MSKKANQNANSEDSSGAYECLICEKQFPNIQKYESHSFRGFKSNMGPKPCNPKDKTLSKETINKFRKIQRVHVKAIRLKLKYEGFVRNLPVIDLRKT